MHVRTALVWLVILFLILHETIPSVQAEFRSLTRRSKRRVRRIRQFVDDDDYDIVGRFKHSPISMHEYRQRQTTRQVPVQEIHERQLDRARDGYGSLYVDGPDYRTPNTFSWTRGVLQNKPMRRTLRPRKIHRSQSAPHSQMPDSSDSDLA